MPPKLISGTSIEWAAGRRGPGGEGVEIKGKIGSYLVRLN